MSRFLKRMKLCSWRRSLNINSKCGVRVKKSDKEKLYLDGFITIIAGSLRIESREQLDTIAGLVKKSGLNFLKGRSL